ncbi:PIN-like domain-containing protein [Priestia aryabhattai]|uniref:PIN-like domain-containing protein n=1 Tax=Priestia aryabhattai TaxID=412384 RepID=UPI002E24DCD4|nr:PIN-like domain-containing protein [Priestia aryabhattai]
MEKWEKYFFQPKSINDILGNAAVFIDTNVLLSAYQWREVTVNEVISVMKILNEEGRLKIPLQVIKEFARNRPKEIVKRMNELEEAISKLQKPNALTQKVPMLEGLEIYEKVKELQDNYEEGLKNYKKGLMELRDELKRLFYEDHILSQLQEIFKTAVFNPPSIKSEDELIKDAEKRFKNQQPPGYKDSSKEENSAGDYIIWANMLELEQNVIFVSNEKKPDWVYTDKHKNTISVRRELTEEFFECSSGHTFGYLSPKELITLLKPSVSEEVKKDLDSSTVTPGYGDPIVRVPIRLPIENKISAVLCEIDPLGLVEAGSDSSEYDSEALVIAKYIKRKQGQFTFGQLVEAVQDVFKLYYNQELKETTCYRIIARILTILEREDTQLLYN